MYRIISVLATLIIAEAAHADLDRDKIAETAGVDASTTAGAVVRVTWGRADVKVNIYGMPLNPFAGLTSWSAFPGNDDLAAVGGNFIMTAEEVQPFLRALREANINIVTLHNHMVGEKPTFYFAHFWGKGAPEELAVGLKQAVDTQEAAGR